MRNYTTQMDAARKNNITPEMEKVAAKERMTPEEIRALVAEGKVAICANKNHKCLDPQGVGSMLKTKINVNLGVSKDCHCHPCKYKGTSTGYDVHFFFMLFNLVDCLSCNSTV